MSLIRLFSLVVAMAAAGPALADHHEKAEFWGELQRVGRWAKKQVMRKGYLASLVKKTEGHHPKFAEAARDALKALNDNLGKCKGCWPNFRLALAGVLKATARGAGKPIAPALKPFLDAIKDGCPKVGQGGKKAVHDAAKAALEALPKGTKRPLRKMLNGAGMQIDRACKLWKRPKGEAEEK